MRGGQDDGSELVGGGVEFDDGDLHNRDWL